MHSELEDWVMGSGHRAAAGGTFAQCPSLLSQCLLCLSLCLCRCIHLMSDAEAAVQQIPQYHGPRLYHEVPDSRDVPETELSRWPSMPVACESPSRLFFSLTGAALTAALVGSVLMWVGAKFAASPSSISGLVVMATGAALACAAVCLWLALLCKGCGKWCCRCCRCCRVTPSRVDVDSDRSAILPDADSQRPPPPLSLQFPQSARFLPPLEPVYQPGREGGRGLGSPNSASSSGDSSSTASTESASDDA